MLTREQARELKTYLELRKISKQDISQALGMSYQQCENLTNGRSEFIYKNAVLFGKAFGVSPAWLMSGEGSMVLAEDAHLLSREEIGRELAAYTKSRGIKNYELGELTKRDESSISAIFRGKLNLTVDYARELSRVLGFSVPWLLTGEGSKFTDAEPEYKEALANKRNVGGGNAAAEAQISALTARNEELEREVERLGAQVRKLLGVINSLTGGVGDGVA